MDDNSNADVDAPMVLEFPGSLCALVELRGFERTDPQLVALEFVAASIQDMKSIEDVYVALEHVHDALMSLGAYSAVDLLLDESERQPGRLAVKCTAVEKKLFGLQAGTFVQGDQGTIEASGHVRNVFGRCETIAATVEQGLSNNTYQVSVTVPRVYQQPWHLDVKASQVFQNDSKWASYVERLRSVSWSLWSEDGVSVGYELGWRTLSDPSGVASPSIVTYLGESIKSSAKMTLAGNGLVTNVEVGGLLDFCKASFGGGVAVELSDTTELVLEGSTGLIVGSAGPADRFHLGGIVPWGSMRGFQTCGVGPFDKRRRPSAGRLRDALGGKCLCSLFSALRFDMPSPTMRALGVRGQIFLQAGVNESGLKEAVKISNWRGSTGVGLVVGTALGLLEVNVCAALASHITDMKTGVQFGLTPGA